MKLFKSYFKIAAACTSFLILGSFSEHHPSAHIPEAKINSSSSIEDRFVLRINSGGNELNIGNQKFVKDEYYAGDSKIFSNTSIEDIGNTTFDALYLTERSTLPNKNTFNYAIPVPNGTFKVKLHFAEIYWGATSGGPGGAGKRVFNVAIENQALLNNLDINKEVGSMNALIKEYTLTVNDQVLNLNFQASKDQPKLSAIEIIEQPDTTKEDPIFINAGGPEVNVNGKNYVADAFYTGGRSYTNYGIPDIKDTNADIIYKSERSTGTGNGGFSYTIPVTNGDYKVKIHFAEIYWGATGGGPGKQGKRLINMSLENKEVLSNLDLIKEVGSETALIKTYSTSVKDGLLNIDMSASVDEPKVSAIEITKISTEEDEVVTRINAGSSAVNIDGKVYESDMNFTGSTSAYTNPNIKDIKNTTQDELYKSERSASVDFGKFGYAIPVEDGDYRVELHFAEIYWGAPGGGNGGVGKRKFSVAVENKKVLENYDMIADLGRTTATVKKYQTTVTDGTLNIDFTASKDRPKIAAIEVFKENEATEEELPLIASFNSGGQDITLDGTLFEEDAYFRGNSKANTTTLTEIADTDIDALYLTERSTQSDKQSFSYDFPVTNGTYQVKLHFAEIYFGAPQSGPGGAGRRLIEVEMEDESRIEDLDIIKEVGTGTALIKTFEVQVSDGELNINLGASVNRPQLCGIQLYGNGELGEEGQDPCTWTELATSELEKLESQAAKIGNKLYTFSGFLNGFIITPETEIYDFENDVWSMGAPMPTPATHVGRAVVNDEVWLIGGFTGNNPGVATDEVYIYNATTDTWRLGPALPAPRGSGAATFADGKVHFFGGLLPDRVTDTNEHYTIDPENPSEGWVAAAPLPMGRNHLSAITLDGLVYAIGGQYGHDREIDYLSFVHAYNPATDTWERKADLPSDRSHFEPCTVSHNGKIIIIGGRRGFFFFDEMTEYDPELNSWSQICKLPEPLLAPAAAIFNDTLVIANGGNGETDLRDNTRFLVLESENTLGTSEDESSLSNSSNLDNSVKLFPNPTQGEITISGIRANSQTVVINIKNITGANLITQKFDTSASSYTMDTANLKTGIYFMEIITDSNSRKVIKFIKK